VSAADLYLQAGRISTPRGRHPDSLQLFDASAGEIAQDIPIVLLVNGASASASEVLAAALQDHGRAVLVGSNSFGKGTVQTVIRLPNEGELILTWARLHSPLGFDINRIGVVPTLCTSGAKEIEAVLDRSFSRSKSRLQLATSLPTTNEARASAGKQCPWQPHEGGDIDISVAKRILDNPELYKHALGRSVPTAGS
jgi:carboxyl-terminal processing protease